MDRKYSDKADIQSSVMMDMRAKTVMFGLTKAKTNLPIWVWVWKEIKFLLFGQVGGALLSCTSPSV